MKNYIRLGCIVVAWGAAAASARAQFPGSFGGGFGNPLSRPAVSPYLNIARGGDPAINYYGLVRPQVAFGRAFQAVEGNVVALQADINQPVQTGQRSSFMTQSKYFMNMYSGPIRSPALQGQMQLQTQMQQRANPTRGR
jgi:hypothetical protein